MFNGVTSTFITLKVLQQVAVSWIFATYVLFLQDSGLSLQQTTLVNLLFMISQPIVDVIAGILADKIGQKRIYLYGLLFFAMGTGVYGISSTFNMFLVSEFISAIGNAFMSEALESWLRTLEGEEISHKAISTASWYSNLISIPAALGGAFIGDFVGLRYPWFISSAIGIAAFTIGIVKTKNIPDVFTTSHESTTATLKQAITLWVTVKELKFIALLSFATSMAYQPFNMFWSPIIKDLGGEIWWMGFVWVGIALFSGVGAKLIGHTKRIDQTTVLWIITTTAFPIGIATVLTHLVELQGAILWVILTGFLIHEIGRGALYPALFTYSNNFIPNEIRATTNSVRSSARMVGAAFGLWLYGGLTNWLQPIDIWLVSATLLLIICLINLLFGNR